MRATLSSRVVLLIFVLAGTPKLLFASDRVYCPSIQIKGSTLKIDGRPVWLGDTIQNWTAVLKRAPRCAHEKNSIKLCIWDAIGLEIGTDLINTKRVHSLV
jgi:hypothetical protein